MSSLVDYPRCRECAYPSRAAIYVNGHIKLACTGHMSPYGGDLCQDHYDQLVAQGAKFTAAVPYDSDAVAS